MTERIQKDELARRLAERMQTDTATATAWIDAIVETLYESFQAGESVTLKGFGSFMSGLSAQVGYSSLIPHNDYAPYWGGLQPIRDHKAQYC